MPRSGLPNSVAQLAESLDAAYKPVYEDLDEATHLDAIRYYQCGGFKAVNALFRPSIKNPMGKALEAVRKIVADSPLD